MFNCLELQPEWHVTLDPTLDVFLQLVQERKFDLIIINETALNSQELPYLEAGERFSPNTPILLITCSQDQASTIHSLQLGAVSFVPATASAQALQQVVVRVLALSKFSRNQQLMLTRCQSCQFEFQLENQCDQISGVVSYLRDVLAAVTGANPRDQMRVAVSIEEALQNAIIHGNLEISSRLRELHDDQFTREMERRQQISPYRERRVHVQAQFTGDSIHLVIADQGPGFDITQLPDPTSPEHLHQPHGRGLLLMRAFMDEINYTPPGNVLTLKKSFARG